MKYLKWVPIFVYYIFLNTAVANEGFHLKTSEAVPAAVRQRMASIFRLEMPAYLTLETSQAKEFLKAENIKAEGIKAIYNCLNTGLKSCTFPIMSLQATGFLDTEGSGLWTNCHVIDGWIRYQKQLMFWSHNSQKLLKNIKKIPVPIKVFTEGGAQLNYKTDQFLVSLASVIDDNDIESSGCNYRNDVVLLKTARKLGTGIPWLKSDINEVIHSEDQRSFIGGYPLPEGRLKNIIKNLSKTGTTQTYFWTIGEIETQSKFIERLLKLSKNPDNYLFAASGAYKLLMTNDSSVGMSGSPILNASGEVMGIFSSILPKNSEKNSENEFPLVSIGITIDGLNFLKFLNED